MYPTCNGFEGKFVGGEGLVVYGLSHAPVIMISDFEGGRVGLKEDIKW